jgi:hypothetical protein
MPPSHSTAIGDALEAQIHALLESEIRAVAFLEKVSLKPLPRTRWRR